MMRLVRTVRRRHLVEATEEEREAERVRRRLADFLRYTYVVVSEGLRSSEFVVTMSRVHECRRGIAFVSHGFFDLDAEQEFSDFPDWFSENTEVFVDDNHVVAAIASRYPELIHVFIYERESRRRFVEAIDVRRFPEGHSFFVRWPERVRSRVFSGSNEESGNVMIFFVAWFREGTTEKMEAVSLLKEFMTGRWSMRDATIGYTFRYVVERTDDEIVFARLGIDRTYRYPFAEDLKTLVDFEPFGRSVVVDDETSTRYYDVDAEVAERIDLFCLPADAKRDISKRATFADDVAFDFS